MNKIIAQGLITVVSFFLLLLILNQVDWYNLFNIDEVNVKTEEVLGEALLATVTPIPDSSKVYDTVNHIITNLCEANEIDAEYIKAHVVIDSEINAFALPNGHLILNTGLITHVNNQEELIGVISHELAHIQLNHIMKKLIKELGLSFIITMTSGNAGTEVLKETVKLLSSTAFDRNLETEADISAVTYMINAKVNPEPFADFLYKLDKNKADAIDHLSWISTHPDAKDRAIYVLDYLKNGESASYKSMLSENEWLEFKEEIRGLY